LDSSVIVRHPVPGDARNFSKDATLTSLPPGTTHKKWRDMLQKRAEQERYLVG
jgi:hypothetical protein